MTGEDDAEPGPDAEAWDRFSLTLARLGRRIQDPEFPGSPTERAEGYRALSRLTTFGLQWALEFGDPDFPAFCRYDDDIVKWGGPNADNQYLRAKVASGRSYRITGNVEGVRQMIVSVNEGDMPLGRFKVFDERHLGQLEIGEDGNVEIVVSAEEHPGNWLALHPDADHVLVRQYVSDWDNDRVADLQIERIGHRGEAPVPPSPEVVAAALDRAAEWVERNLEFWNDYLRRIEARAPANQLSGPGSAPGGARDILYGGGWWRLDPSEALVVTFDEPHAQYWSIQLYSRGWFESLDIAHRQVSLNGHQCTTDADGRVRVVLAATDPGCANWLDTEGRPEGLVSYRWVFAANAPVPESAVVAAAAVRDYLPPETHLVDESERAEVLARRRRAVAARFRR